MKWAGMSKGEITKERIIAAAAPVFNRNGFAGTSLSDLMQATGLQKGGIYRHFKSKEELAVAAFDCAWRIAWEARWGDIDKSANAVDQLRKFVANFIDRRAGRIQGGCPVLNTAADAENGNPVLRDHARKALERWLRRIREVVAAGIRNHEIRTDVDPRAVALLIVSTLEGATIVTRLQRSDQPFEQVRRHLDNYLESLVERDYVRPSIVSAEASPPTSLQPA